MVGKFLHHLWPELLIAMQILVTALIKVQSEHSGLPQFPPTRHNVTWCNFPSHSCVFPCVRFECSGKKSHSKKDPSFPPPSTALGASQAPFSRGVEWPLYESGCSCQMQHVKWSLNKQHRGLCSQEWPLELGGVTFGKIFGPKTLFQLLFNFFWNTPVKNKKWHFVCLCEPQHGEISFRFQVFIFGRGCWTERGVVLYSRKWTFSWSNLPLAYCPPKHTKNTDTKGQFGHFWII